MTEPRFVEVYSEANPNPDTLKFVLNFMLNEGAPVEYNNKQEAANSPMAVEIFDEFSFVDKVFISSNFVTLTRNDKTDWFEVNGKVRAFLKQYFLDKKPAFLETPTAGTPEETKEASAPTTDEPEVVLQIKTILEEYVRPAVEQDGGAISFHSFDDGVVKVLLQGACSGCPSSTLTLKDGIENLMKRMIPQVKEVVAEGV